MITRLLEREGTGDIGLITNGGMEDQLRFGRGIQSWADRSYAGRLHAREHEHPEPLVPRENIRGVRGRMNMAGLPTLPLYEEEAYEAVHDLLDRGVRVICVCLVYSYLNDSHEQTVREIAEEVMDERGEEVPVWLSSEQKPIRGEAPRMNTLVIEAYAAEPSREQLYQVDEGFAELGSEAPVRVLTSSGGTVAPEHDWLADTTLSGPIGGVFGGEFDEKNREFDLDEAATDEAREESQTFEAFYEAERDRVQDGDVADVVAGMYRDAFDMSDEFEAGFHVFWDLGGSGF